MNRTCRLLVGLSLLSLVLAGGAWGQSAPPDRKKGSPGRVYNPQTVVTVSGIVVSVNAPPRDDGLPYLVYLTLQVGAEKISVFLGPNLYVDKLAGKIQALDKIQVTGSKVTWQGKPVIVAAEIKKGNQVFPFRRPDGTPYWRQRRSH
jgi:hypothetical protein